jgi:hypothetical protein
LERNEEGYRCMTALNGLPTQPATGLTAIIFFALLLTMTGQYGSEPIMVLTASTEPDLYLINSIQENY